MRVEILQSGSTGAAVRERDGESRLNMLVEQVPLCVRQACGAQLGSGEKSSTGHVIAGNDPRQARYKTALCDKFLI